MERITSPEVYEPPPGTFVNAIRVGDQIFLSGLTGRDKDGKVVPGGAYEQTRTIFERIKNLLEAAGSGLNDIVRLTVYVTNINDRVAYAKAKREYMGDHLFCSALVEVSRLVEPELQVEVEATAIAGSGPLKIW